MTAQVLYLLMALSSPSSLKSSVTFSLSTSEPPPTLHRQEAVTSPVEQYKLRGYVNDFAGMIDEQTQAQLDAICRDLWEKKRIRLVFVTVKSLAGLTAKDFATQLGNHWHQGAETDNRAVLYLLAQNERQYFLAVSKSLVFTFSNEDADRVVRKIIPMLRKGDYAIALTSLAKQLHEELPQNPADSRDAINAMFPDAPEKTQSIDCFRTLTLDMSVNAVVQKCGRPDEDLGSGMYIFVWRMADGSTVSLGTGSLQRIFNVLWTDPSGKRQYLVEPK